MKQIKIIASRFFYLIIVLFIVLSIACNNGGNSDNSDNGNIDTNLPGNSALLTWEGPTVNANLDSTPLVDLAGYRVYMSTTSGVYMASDIVAEISSASSGGGSISFQIDDLTPGTYYFSVTAYDNASPANESVYSSEVSKFIP